MSKFIASAMLSIASALTGAQANAQSCNSGEIEVYRDSTKIICKDRADYAACIKKSGEASRTDKRNCAYQVQGEFADGGLRLQGNASECVRGTLEGGATLRAALKSCTPAAQYSTDVIEKAVNKMNECFERLLVSQKQREEICKRE